jgi:hypothetical protein
VTIRHAEKTRYGGSQGIMIDISSGNLGKTSETFTLTTSDEQRIAAAALAQQGQRSIEICSRDLDPRIYDHRAFVEAVKQLALASRFSRVRILVQNPGYIIKHGHRLVNLSQHLSSSIEIRVPAPEHKDYNEAFLIVDDCGLIHRKMADRYEGTLNFNAPREAGYLLKHFKEIWRTSQPEPRLKRLYF